MNEPDLSESPPFFHDQFLFFGDSITQSDGDPALGFSCYQSLQHGIEIQFRLTAALTGQIRLFATR